MINITNLRDTDIDSHANYAVLDSQTTATESLSVSFFPNFFLIFFFVLPPMTIRFLVNICIEDLCITWSLGK